MSLSHVKLKVVSTMIYINQVAVVELIMELVPDTVSEMKEKAVDTDTELVYYIN